MQLQLPVERELLPENSVKYLYQHNKLVYLKKYTPSILYRALCICTVPAIIISNVGPGDFNLKLIWLYLASP